MLNKYWREKNHNFKMFWKSNEILDLVILKSQSQKTRNDTLMVSLGLCVQAQKSPRPPLLPQTPILIPHLDLDDVLIFRSS